MGASLLALAKSIYYRFRWTSYTSVSKENKLSPMFECWTADRVWRSFLFLTTWKLSHVIKTKFVENEKRVLKKKTSIEKRKEEEKKRKRVSDVNWTCAFGSEKQRKKYWINPLDHASKRWRNRMIDSLQV